MRNKKIWCNKLALSLIAAQILFTLLWKKEYLSINLVYIIAVNLIATLLINYNYNWLGKNEKEKQEEYFKSAIITYHALKFACGIIMTTVLSSLTFFINIAWVKDNASNIVVSWYLTPFVMVFVSAAILDSDFKDGKNLPDKINKIPSILQNFILLFAEFDDNKKVIYNRKFYTTLITICSVILFVILYNISKYIA